jgi:hypothetical protein
MLKSLLIMNLVDAFATMVWVETGVAEEANPLMSWALEDDIGFFILSKIFLVIFSVLLLWRSRKYRIARILTVPVFLLYAYIIIIHIFIFFNLIFQGGL